MRKALKIAGLVIGILVLLVVAAGIALPFLVDPDDFKPQIVSAVEDATGRQFEIPGEIELSVFPWLGVKMGAARLGNAAGFGDEPMASIETAQVRVKILPLLRRKVEVGKIVIGQPVIRLERNADGKSNWEDFAADQPATEPSADTAADQGATPELSIEGLEIRDAHVVYRDAAAGMTAELMEFDLQAGNLGMQADFPLSMGGSIKLTGPELAGTFELKSQVAVDAPRQRYTLTDTTLDFDLEGGALPTSPLPGKISWQRVEADMEAGTAQVQGLSLQALGVAVDVALDASGVTSALKVNGKLELAADDLELLARQLEEQLPEGLALSGKASGVVSFGYDQSAGTANISEFSLRALGLDANGAMNVSNLDDAPIIEGRIGISEFSPGQLLVKLGQSLPATQDGEVLDTAALSAAFRATPDSATVDELKLSLDQSNIDGRIEITSFENFGARFSLALDQIDVDRYLPPAEATGEDAGGETPLDQMEIPADLVRGLDIVGEVTIGKLKAFDFNSTDVKIGITAQNDRLRVHPAQATFYGGGYRGDIRLDASGKVPVVAVDEHVENVQLAPLVKDVLEVENLSGTANMVVTATARGGTVGALSESLDGKFNADIKDGALEGFNVWESIREAYAKLKGRSYTSNAPDRTEFAELSASGTIRQGVLHNDDLTAKLPFLRITGKGDVDIAAATMDYTIEATVLKSPELTGGIEELVDTPIPVRLSGSIMDPKVRPDVKGVLEAKARAAVERKEAELRQEAERREQELRDKAKQKADEEKKRLEDRLKDKLKDFLG